MSYENAVLQLSITIIMEVLGHILAPHSVEHIRALSNITKTLNGSDVFNPFNIKMNAAGEEDLVYDGMTLSSTCVAYGTLSDYLYVDAYEIENNLQDPSKQKLVNIYTFSDNLKSNSAGDKPPHIVTQVNPLPGDIDQTRIIQLTEGQAISYLYNNQPTYMCGLNPVTKTNHSVNTSLSRTARLKDVIDKNFVPNSDEKLKQLDEYVRDATNGQYGFHDQVAFNGIYGITLLDENFEQICDFINAKTDGLLDIPSLKTMRSELSELLYEGEKFHIPQQ